MLFALMCFDRPAAGGLRMKTRQAHLAYVGERLSAVKVAGPMLDEAQAMVGSLFILDVADRAAVDAFNAADPYQKAGLFSRVEIRGFRASIGTL